MNPFKFVVCLLRNEHAYVVSDAAFTRDMRHYFFTGNCKRCKTTSTRLGIEWAAAQKRSG